MELPDKVSKIVIAVRWIARLISILLLALVVMLALGEGFPSPFTFTSIEFLLFVALLIMLAGFILAWRNEGLGGLLILVGFLMFFLTNYIGSRSFKLGIFFLLFPVSGIMFLFCWHRCRKSETLLKH